MSKYTVKLICCGRDDGEYSADTWQEANDFRESYTGGVGVNPYGYSSPAHEPGHRRAAIITAPKPNDPLSNLEGDLGSSHMQGTPKAQGHEADNLSGGSAR